MRVLVIDSHKGSEMAPTENLHWENARTIAHHLGGDLIWSYPSVNDQIRGGYEAIVFVHASHYAYTDYAWLEASPDAALFYVVNEYNLGEPRTLWMAAKRGRRYQVIANHPPEPSKIVQKYVSAWHRVNLNALSYVPPARMALVPSGQLGFADAVPSGCVYYGSFRKDRVPSFQRWLTGRVIVSTHEKNRDKFRAAGITGPFVGRLKFGVGGLKQFTSSLYLEDETTHVHFNELANRFYEALRDNVKPVFASGCEATLDKAGYEGALVLAGPEELDRVNEWAIPAGWHDQAAQERREALDELANIITSAPLPSTEPEHE